MHAVFYGMGVCAICVTLGFLFRLTATLLGLGITYVFLLEAAFYLNHFYLLCWVGALLALTPAHRALSADAWLRPRLRSQTAPFWAVLAIRTQMGLVYVGGGIAKLNPDWLRGYPMRLWLPPRSEFPLLGPLFEEFWMALAMSWAALLFDLLIVPLLLWHRTRWFALGAAFLFNMLNASLFTIGIFPLLAMAATLMLLPPGWPRSVFNWPLTAEPDPATEPRRISPALAGLPGLALTLQVLLPFRHLLYPGSPHWTEEGHRFSWHMKLRDKESEGLFWVVDPETGEETEVDPEELLTSRQCRKMMGKPELILQFAHHLASTHAVDGRRPAVHADIRTSLNGRPHAQLIDASVDLASQPRSLNHYDWVLPLTAPLYIW